MQFADEQLSRIAETKSPVNDTVAVHFPKPPCWLTIIFPWRCDLRLKSGGERSDRK
jgi:hypothetical protein